MKKAVLLLIIALSAIEITSAQNPEGSAAQITVVGVVRDSIQTIPYASVYLKNRPGKGVQADSKGAFALRIDKRILPDTLIISSIGYCSAFRAIYPSADTLKMDVRLKQDLNILKEVVVKGKKSIWRKKIRENRQELQAARIDWGVRNFRFVFRIYSARYINIKRKFWFELAPPTNYIIINKDSLTFSGTSNGGMRISLETGERFPMSGPVFYRSGIMSRPPNLMEDKNNFSIDFLMSRLRLVFIISKKTGIATVYFNNVYVLSGAIEPLPLSVDGKAFVDIDNIKDKTGESSEDGIAVDLFN